jgi:hypothetical protein
MLPLFVLSPFFDFALKLSKLEYPELGTGLSGFSIHVKFGH